MEEYLEVKNTQFQFLKPGDYIRWKSGNAITVGGSIVSVGKAKGEYNWRIKGFGGSEISMYWNKVESVFVRKSIWYEVLEKRVSVLSGIVNFLIKTLNLTEEFAVEKKTIQTRLQRDEREREIKVRIKRRSKSVPAKKKGRKYVMPP